MNWTGEWNREVHEAIEAKVLEEYKRLFPPGEPDAGKTISEMRMFYYGRMTNTTNVLIGGVALLVAFVSLIVSAIALLK